MEVREPRGRTVGKGAQRKESARIHPLLHILPSRKDFRPFPTQQRFSPAPLSEALRVAAGCQHRRAAALPNILTRIPGRSGAPRTQCRSWRFRGHRRRWKRPPRPQFQPPSPPRVPHRVPNGAQGYRMGRKNNTMPAWAVHREGMKDRSDPPAPFQHRDGMLWGAEPPLGG